MHEYDVMVTALLSEPTAWRAMAMNMLDRSLAHAAPATTTNNTHKSNIETVYTIVTITLTVACSVSCFL